MRPLARADERAQLLMTIPGVAELLGLTLASEIGDISRFPSARKLVGYSGLTPTIKQSGQSSRTGRLSKAGPNTLRWAAVEAAQQAGGPPTPGTASTPTSSSATARAIVPRPPSRAKSSSRLARALAPRALQAQRLERHRSCPGKLLHSSGRLTAQKRSEKPGQLQPDQRAPPSAERDLSSHCPEGRIHPRNPRRDPRPLDIPAVFKETSGSSPLLPLRRIHRPRPLTARPGRHSNLPLNQQQGGHAPRRSLSRCHQSPDDQQLHHKSLLDCRATAHGDPSPVPPSSAPLAVGSSGNFM